MGVAKDVMHNIDTGDNPPIKSRPIRRSQAGDTEVNQEINKLLEAGLIKPSKSPWLSPILIVKKKDGTNWVVIDYRRLNEITRKDVYLLPSISDALDRLGGAKYFSAMDLVSGYWQKDSPEEDQQKAAIITPQGLFQPTRMPQGLCNAPATFQKTMDNILSDLKISCVLVYLDDINVFSKTFSEHLDHLREVLHRLSKNNFKLKAKKCHFYKKQLEYSSYKINQEGLQPQESKLEAIEKMAKPKNKRDIQVFLGMIGYYRRFIPNFAQLAGPLFHLLKGNTHFLWNEECTKAFKSLKMKLMTAPILMYPDFSKQFIVQTDASLTAVGGVLSQINDLGEEHPVAYCSRTLNPAERNYTVTERECLAVIYLYQQFRVYLHGTKFKVVTDHSSLQWLKYLKDLKED